MECSDVLIGPNEVAVIQELISEEEQRELMVWAEDKFSRGRLVENPQDPGGFLTPYQSERGTRSLFTQGAKDPGGSTNQFVWVPPGDAPLDSLPEIFWAIRDRVIHWLRLKGIEEDHYKGSFLTYTQPGAGVHQHLDAKVVVDGETCEILRCNVLFRRPEVGGHPKIGNTEFDVPDRGAWALHATALVHSASVVEGSYRGTLSFGFLIRPAQLWLRRFQVPERLRQHLGLYQDDGRRAFLQQLRSAPGASTVPKDRLALMDYVVGCDGSFNTTQAAEAIGLLPPQLFPALIDLQRSGFVESMASLEVSSGSLVII